MCLNVAMWNLNMAKVKLCYMDTDSFIVCKEAEDIYVDFGKNIQARCLYFDLWIRNTIT